MGEIPLVKQFPLTSPSSVMPCDLAKSSSLQRWFSSMSKDRMNAEQLESLLGKRWQRQNDS